MQNRVVMSFLVIMMAGSFCVIAFAQTAPAQSGAVRDQKAAPAPAPIHDISGLWDPTPRCRNPGAGPIKYAERWETTTRVTLYSLRNASLQVP